MLAQGEHRGSIPIKNLDRRASSNHYLVVSLVKQVAGGSRLIANSKIPFPSILQDFMSKKVYAVSALIKANEILDFLLLKGEATFTEIYTSLGHPKSSTYKMLSTLEAMGFIRSVGGSSRYSLGLKLLELGSKAAQQVDLSTEARPIVKRLSMDTKRTCHLGILDDIDVVYIAKENTHCLIHIDTWVGRRIGVYCTAMGKILLAWRDEEEVQSILNRVDFVQVAPNTITSKDELIEQFAEIRERGWALDDEESTKMVRCVAAPVWDRNGRVCAALSVSTLTDLDSYEQLIDITNKVQTTARELTDKLGGLTRG